MMNTLWIFGDSFSSDFDYNNLHENHISYMNIIGVNHIPVWGTVLAEKLGCQIKNLAKGGSSNYQIFQDYCDSCHLIQPNDIVIVGWGLIDKFRISQNNKVINIHPNNTRDYENMSKSTLDEMVKNRGEIYNGIDIWAGEIYGWESAMNTLSKNKGYKIYFWSTEEDRLIYKENEEHKKSKNYLCSESKQSLIHYLRNVGCLSMSQETNNVVGDSHFGLQGHNKQAEIFYNEIKK
jgi:hypothetical protein